MSDSVLSINFKPKQEGNTVVFSNVDPAIRAYFASFSRGQGDQKTAVFHKAFKLLLQTEGYIMNNDGTLVSKQQIALALDENPEAEAEFSDDGKRERSKR